MKSSKDSGRHKGNPFAWKECGHPTQPAGQQECHVCLMAKVAEMTEALNKIHDLVGQMGLDHPHLGAIQAWCHKVTGECEKPPVRNWADTHRPGDINQHEGCSGMGDPKPESTELAGPIHDAPPIPVYVGMDLVGTETWWKQSEVHGSRGIVNAILCLVGDHNISVKKGVELVEALMTRRQEAIPLAPWEEVRFGGSDGCWFNVQLEASVRSVEDRDVLISRLKLDVERLNKNFSAVERQRKKIQDCWMKVVRGVNPNSIDGDLLVEMTDALTGRIDPKA